MTASAPVAGVLAAALAEHRDRCNALVTAARRQHTDFDVAVLERVIRGPLDALVTACEQALPGSGSRVLAAVFAPVVALVAQRRLSGSADPPVGHDALLAELPRFARAVADEPRLVVGSLANAVWHLERAGVPADAWLSRLPDADAATVLRAGQVAAWALGLSHARESALDVAAALDDATLGAVVGADGPLPVDATVAALRADRWARPGADRSTATAGRIVHRVGGFRGFGGPFLALPVAGVRDGAVVIRSGGEAWALHADAFGATLTRTDPAGVEVVPAAAVAVPDGVRALSAARAGDLVAATVATSYHVLVIEPAR